MKHREYIASRPAQRIDASLNKAAPADGPALCPPMQADIRSAIPAQRCKNTVERVMIAGMICDFIVIAAAMAIGFWLRFHSFIRAFGQGSSVTFLDYAGYAGGSAISMSLILAYGHLYEDGVVLRYRRVARLILEASALWTLGFLSLSLILKFQPPLSRLYAVVCGATICCSLLLSRWVFSRIIRLSSILPSLRQRVLIVGWNDEAGRLAAAFGTDMADAYELAGCVNPKGHGFAKFPFDRRLILGDQEEIAEIIERRKIDMVDAGGHEFCTGRDRRAPQPL